MKKSRNRLAPGTGPLSLALALALALSLMLPLIDQAADGPGFDSPADAARAYLIALKNQDLDAMLATFAMENLIRQVDFEEMLAQFGAYSPTFIPLMPNSGPFAIQLNTQLRRGRLATQIANQFMFFHVPDIQNNLEVTGRLSIQETRDDFLKRFEEGTRDSIFRDLVITGESVPEELAPNFGSEPSRENLQRMADRLGLDMADYQNVVINFQADGKPWIFCAAACRIEGRWYLESLGGQIGQLLGLNFLIGGLAPWKDPE